MIRPIVKLRFTDGTKKRLEIYHRPPVIILEGKDTEGKKVETTFVRTGPDEYRQKVVKQKDEVEGKIVVVGG